MSLKPDYLVRIGGREVSPSAAGPLVALEVDTAKNAGAAMAVLDFGGGVDPEAALDDRLTIELGWSGNRSRVFTGLVHGLEPAVAGMRVRAFGEEMKLMRAGRQAQVFENQTHGDIVKSLAQKARIALGSIEDGYRSPRLYMHHQTPYEYCAVLADRLGFDFYAGREGELSFARFARRAADHVLRYGVDLVNATIRSAPSLAGVTVVPESPASSAGDETASWLIKDPSPHAATEGRDGTLVVSDPSLRTRDAAKLAAAAIMTAAGRSASTGIVSLAGRADIALGQAVELKGLRPPGGDGLYEVRRVNHRLGRGRGFQTTLGLARMPA